MPKAAKAKTNTATAQSNPLGAKSANTSKKAPSDVQKRSIPPDGIAAQQANAQAPKNTPPTRKPNDDRNYLLHVVNVLTSNPMITRLLSIPPSLTFGKLHRVLQIAFGWADCHMHTFRIEVPTPCQHKWHKSSECQTPFPFKEVLELQSADNLDMGLGGTMQDEDEGTLSDVLEKEEWDGKPISSKADVHITYEYDMGDGWEHQIQLLGRAEKGLHAALTSLPEEKAQKVLCISGEGHPCAEDCGSAPGWEGLKNAFTKQKGDKGLKEWYKKQCANGEKKGLDPWKWDLMDVNADLEEMEV
ncbi:MAG: hypothetical protein L6R39_007262 [Caloplaca ligustica]|nr:MAG: hypothetical protein L6R39_007262 [Caloplaca ligustica]